MSLHLINEIWKILKPDMENGDLDGAAETLVNYLIEEDYSPAEIKSSFRDPAIRSALSFYEETPPGEFRLNDDEDESWLDEDEW